MRLVVVVSRRMIELFADRGGGGVSTGTLGMMVGLMVMVIIGRQTTSK